MNLHQQSRSSNLIDRKFEMAVASYYILKFGLLISYLRVNVVCRAMGSSLTHTFNSTCRIKVSLDNISICDFLIFPRKSSGNYRQSGKEINCMKYQTHSL